VPDTGDDRAQRERRFRTLYQEHYGSIRAYAVRRLASAEDVADVVAETFTAAWRRLGDIPPPPADRLWLFGVARRVVAGRQRSLRRRRDLLARLAASNYQPGATMGPAATTSAGDHVIEALGRLRPGEREALLLVVWDQLSHAEAAVVLGCSANAVAIRVYRAKIRLREQLGISGGTVPHNRSAAPRLAAHALPRDRN
jgi:RNA polymerase sigma-70 factor (ECF subfamily)